MSRQLGNAPSPALNPPPFRAQVAREEAAGCGRQAALLVHAMCPPDRDWLMSQLGEAARGALAGMLTELETLGIPADGAFVERALAEAGSRAPAAPPERAAPLPATDGTPLELVTAAAPESIADLLRDEPPGLVALLLAVHEWPWRADVLAELEAYQRLRVGEHLPRGEGGVPPATNVPAPLAEQLVAGLAERLRCRGPQAPRAAVPPWGRWAPLGRMVAAAFGFLGLAVRRETLP